MNNPNWVLDYRRKVLDHLQAPQDVDLDTVKITPAHVDIDDYEWIETDDGPEEHSVERSYFEITVTWLHHLPTHENQQPEPQTPGEPALYQHGRILTDQQAVTLLLGLDP